MTTKVAGKEKHTNVSKEPTDVVEQYNLGAKYANSSEGGADSPGLAEARKWWTLAAAQGDLDAIAGLKVLDQREQTFVLQTKQLKDKETKARKAAKTVSGASRRQFRKRIGQ